MTQATQPVSGPHASRWEDFVDVFVAPAELFRRRAGGDFGIALLVFFIVSATFYFATRSAMAPVFDVEWQRAVPAMLKANPNLTPEQIASGRKMAESFGAVVILIGALLVPLLVGLATWLVGGLLGASVRYAQGATIATYALFPRLIESLLNAVQAAFLDERAITSRYSVSLGVARFLAPDSVHPLVLALAGRIDLFTLWVTVLIAVGLKVIGKLTVGQAALGAALVWLIGALPALYQAYRVM